MKHFTGKISKCNGNTDADACKNKHTLKQNYLQNFSTGNMLWCWAALSREKESSWSMNT